MVKIRVRGGRKSWGEEPSFSEGGLALLRVSSGTSGSKAGHRGPVSFSEITEKSLTIHLGILMIRIDTWKLMCLVAIMAAVV